MKLRHLVSRGTMTLGLIAAGTGGFVAGPGVTHASAACGDVSGAWGTCESCGLYWGCAPDDCQLEKCYQYGGTYQFVTFCIAWWARCQPDYSGCSGGGCEC